MSLLGLGLMLASAAPVVGQAGTRTTPDGKQVLISEDIGGERWAIALNLNDGTATGNVFRPDGTPQFVWCERVGRALGAPGIVEITLSCSGADGCVSSPCLGTAWTALGQVRLPGSFFLPATDPFSPLRTGEHFCDPIAHHYEELGGEPSYALDSAYCNYLTAMQLTLTDIEPGDEVRVRLWHFALTADEPAEAYIALQVGERMLWQARLPIPCRAGIVGSGAGDCPESPVPAEADPAVSTATFDAPAGTPIYFHIQNHGQNSYSLLEVTIAGGRALVAPTAWEVVSRGLPFFPPDLFE